MNTYTVLLLVLAGGLGTVARYGTGLAATAMFGTGYPVGTYAVNVFGSFLFGFVFGSVTDAQWRLILLTGFLGGLTTFSAFASENYEMLSNQRYLAFAVHCIGQNALGILAVLLGIQITESWK